MLVLATCGRVWIPLRIKRKDQMTRRQEFRSPMKHNHQVPRLHELFDQSVVSDQVAPDAKVSFSGVCSLV